MVRKELRGLANFLRKPAGDVLFLGGLSFLAGTSLWLVIPILLVMFGVGAAVAFALIPWFVAAIVMVITWKVMDWAGTPDRWKYTLAIVFGLISLTPTFIDWIQQAMATSVSATAATQAQAVRSQGFLSTMLDMISEGPLFVATFMILIFMAIGLASLVRVGSIGAFVAGFLALALGFGLAMNVVGLAALPAVEDTADLSFSDEIQGPDAPPELSASGSHFGGKGGHGAPFWTWWELGISITQPVKKRDFKYSVRKDTPVTGKKTVIYRRLEKFEFKGRYSDGINDGTIDASALIDVTPPTTRVAPEYREGPWKLVRVEKFKYTTEYGRMDLSLSKEDSNLRLSVTVANDDSTSNEKAVLLFEKEIVQPMGTKEKETRGGGTEEGKGPFDKVPMYLWVLGIGAVTVPATVYAYESQRARRY